MALQVAIPRAVQLVIDDVGWREGWRLDHHGGPFRAGIDRLLDVADYVAIAELGAALSIRPTAAVVLCEWDRENVCAKHPTTTMYGAAWDNRERAGEWSDTAAELFRSHAANLELALHGVGHEHWEDGVMTRAEWYGGAGTKWRWDDLRGHLDCFTALLDQHGLGPAAGQRFPPHFVPCAFCYLWDDADETDTGALVATAGVELVSLPFASSGFHRRTPLLAGDGGLNHGRLVIDRGTNGVPWHAVDCVPAAVLGAVPDDDRILRDAGAEGIELDAEAVRLLLARRAAGDPEVLKRLAAAHRRVGIELARLHGGRGWPAADLLAVVDQAVDEAVTSYAEDATLPLDLYVEELVRRGLERLESESPPAPAERPPVGSICGIHWPNLLHREPARNGEAVARWVEYLRAVEAQPGQYLAGNVRECFAQWAWHHFARIEAGEDSVTIDIRGVPAGVRAIIGELPVVIEVGGAVRLGRAAGVGARTVWYRRLGSRALIGVRLDGDGPATITFDLAHGPLEPVVLRAGTYNVLDLRAGEGGLEVDLELYGAQAVDVATGFPPAAVEATGAVRLEGTRNNPALGVCRVALSTRDIHGGRGTVRIFRES